MGILLLGYSGFAEAAKIEDISTNSDTVGLYERFEISFDVSTTYTNPFDPDEVDIMAYFTSPSGEVFSIPAFHYQDYSRDLVDGVEQFTPLDSKSWKIRFAPTEIGEYWYYIELKDKDGVERSDTLKFESIPSEKDGFVRVDEENPRYLLFDSKRPYIPLGFNVCWISSSEGSFGYDYYFSRLSENGGNWARIWMCHYYEGLTIEWGDYHPTGYYKGLGKYSTEVAWRLDHILEVAEELGIYIQLVLQHHSQFETVKWSSWDNNPYNSANGGMLDSSMEFFTNEEANKLFDRRARYIIARWGYSPNILAWELWNEVDGVKGFNSSVVDQWQTEKAEMISDLDPWDHLMTTSYALPYYLLNNQDWESPGLDLIQVHLYMGEIVDPFRESMEALREFKKPCIIGEFGIDWLGNYIATDKGGINIHNGIWASLVMGYAGGAMSWWWDNYFDVYNLYHLLAAPKSFTQRERLAEYGEPSLDWKLKGEDISNLEALGLKGKDRALLWVHDKRSVWNGLKTEPFPEQEGVSVEIDKLDSGDYRIEFWDTFAGYIIDSEVRGIGSGNNLEIHLPEFSRDIAVKIKLIKQEEGEEGCGCSVVDGGSDSPAAFIVIFLFTLFIFRRLWQLLSR